MSRPVLMGGLLLVLVVGSIGGLLIYSLLSRCMGGEREALSEFAHYQEPDYGPGPWGDVCTVRYTTEDSWEEVLGYYDKQLRQHGWAEVEASIYHRKGPPTVVPGNRLSELSTDPESAEVTLSARKDGRWLEVWYEPPDKSDPDLPDRRALVTIEAGGY